MVSTNFTLWCVKYDFILKRKYIEFCSLFSEDVPSDYNTFVNFVWLNTHKYTNIHTGKKYAIIDNV